MRTKHWAIAGFCLIAVVVLAQNVAVYKETGGAKLVVATGGELEIQSGGTLDIQSGASVTLAAAVSFTSDTTFSTGTVTFTSQTIFSSTVIRTAQEYCFSAGGKPGATKGWVTTGTAVNLFNYTLPASIATTATMVIPISGLHVGDTITGWKLVGQIESAGGIVELDGDLRKLTTVSTAITDASVGAITPIHVVADTAVATAKTGLTEVVAATESFYVLLSGTTAGSTDIDIQGVTVTVTTN